MDRSYLCIDCGLGDSARVCLRMYVSGASAVCLGSDP